MASSLETFYGMNSAQWLKSSDVNGVAHVANKEWRVSRCKGQGMIKIASVAKSPAIVFIRNIISI